MESSLAQKIRNKLILSQTLISVQKDRRCVHFFKTLISLGKMDKLVRKEVLYNDKVKMNKKNWSMGMPHTEIINISSSRTKR